MPGYLTTLAELPEAHHMEHPGKLNPSRLDFTLLNDVVSEHVILPAGKNLHDAVIAHAQALGSACGVATINGGGFSTTRFTTGGPAREGKSANYTYIRDYGPAELISGTLVFGRAEDAPHFVHCHAKLASNPYGDESGGHFFAPDCIIDEPISAQMEVFTKNSITKCASAETLHAIFEIDQSNNSTHDDGLGREYFVRVHPNEDLPTALERFCLDQNIENALISASLGSLNKPALMMRRQVQKITSVGTETLSLTGELLTERNGNCRATLSCTLVDENGTAFSGYLVKGHSPVCITAEIYLMEITDPSLINSMREVRDASI